MAALVRPARPDDWPQLWPMLEAMGTKEREESSYPRFLSLVDEPSWLGVVARAAPRVRYLQWQAHEHRSAPFYERLGYRGDPCPQPAYPEFEVTVGPVAQG